MLKEQYIRLEKIGEGTYATVHKARNLHTNTLVAIKDIFVNAEEGCPSTALREIALLKELGQRHPNIVRLLDVLHDPDGTSLSLVFEYCEADLKQYMDGLPGGKERRMRMCEVRDIVRQIVGGVAACHRLGIIHRDLKPQNILIWGGGGGGAADTKVVKLGDFGLARGTAVPVAGFSNEVVTLWYRAPELLLGATGYGAEVDMWAVGCIVVEMLRGGVPLIPGKNAQDQLQRTFAVLGSPTDEEWADLEKSVGSSISRSTAAAITDLHLHSSNSNNNNNSSSNSNNTTPKGLLGLQARVEDAYWDECGIETCRWAIDFCRCCLQYSPARRLDAQHALAHPFLQQQQP